MPERLSNTGATPIYLGSAAYKALICVSFTYNCVRLIYRPCYPPKPRIRLHSWGNSAVFFPNWGSIGTSRMLAKTAALVVSAISVLLEGLFKTTAAQRKFAT